VTPASAQVLDARELHARLDEPDVAASLMDAPALCVDVESFAALGRDAGRGLRRRLGDVPAVTVGVGDPDLAPASASTMALTTVVAADQLEDVVARVRARPRAAVTLDRVLRVTETAGVGVGLAAEAHAYSTLLAGAEFAAWRDGAERRPESPVDPAEPCVAVERDGSTLRVRLDRPAFHNAFDAAMRDQLFDALELARVDGATRVELGGNGPSFCSGGATWEFGTAADPAEAAAVRLARSVGAQLHAVRDRLHVRIHGACIGAGIELAAFGGRVSAMPDAFATLPEIDMGLVPGAGGTVSLVRRIGRQRTARLALTTSRLDASEMRRIGLVDEIDEIDEIDEAP
jgi:enoyl-CoA hydratase/carnithine racemase